MRQIIPLTDKPRIYPTGYGRPEWRFACASMARVGGFGGMFWGEKKPVQGFGFTPVEAYHNWLNQVK